MNELVSVTWLQKNLSDKNLILLDVSLEKTVDRGQSENPLQTIPGAKFFDLKGMFSNHDSPFPNTLPSPERFEEGCQQIGINRASKIIVFDSNGIYSSPRVWWMFKVMGHEQVAVLDGGLPLWIKQGNGVEYRKEANYPQGDFQAIPSMEYVKSYEEVLANVEEQSFTIVDARSKGRFEGTADEPRKGMKSGHIPDSINIPFQSVLDDGKFKPEAELKKLFDETCPVGQTLVYSCGSGLTACIVMLAGELAMRDDKYLFDGSWTEWAERQGLADGS